MKTARRAALTAATVNAIQTDGSHGFFARLAAVPRMFRDTLTGDYKGLGRGRLFAMSLALAYLISPVDLLPEAILTIPGLVDDAAVAIWLLAAAMASTDDYLALTAPQPVYATATIIDDPAYPRG